MPKLISAFALAFFLSHLLAVEKTIRISEPEMRASIGENEIAVMAPVWNDSAIKISGELQVALLDPNDAVVASSKSAAILKPGKTSITAHLLRNDNVKSDGLLWHRLRYQFITEKKPLVQGIVALGAATPDMFQFRIAHARSALPGKPYTVRVHTAHPITHKAVKGVQVKGILSFDSSKGSESVTSITNSSGDAVLTFHIPRASNDGGDVQIEVRNGGQLQKESFDFELDSHASSIISTDKLLYQPGQSLHARAIVMGPDRRAIANEKVEFKLQDSENKILLYGNSITNDFGIASIDWELPDNVELGYYLLQLSAPDNNHHPNVLAATSIEVSRYDLPNFTVTAKPDRLYYLPDQNASVEVLAKYLFGKELTKGDVKLVREEERHWDSRKRKMVVNTSDEQFAQLDKSGRTLLKIDLSKFHTALNDEEYMRFNDLNFAAYVTDPTSGKTEQRRFTIRLSRYPIHIYVSKIHVGENSASFYISTYYPDGNPAECNIAISEKPEADDKAQSFAKQLLRKIKTNSYGVAKVSDLPLLDNDEDNHRIVFDVRDKKGISAPFEETMWDDNEQYIQVETDKTIYKANEPITVSLYVPGKSSGNIAVDLLRDSGGIRGGTVLWTGRIRIRNHRGFTIIPFLPEFKDSLTISAYSFEYDSLDREEIARGGKTIIYPNHRYVKVKIGVDRASYKPGDEVTSTIDVDMPSGSAAVSALGAVVVDKAVEERIRTDQEFSGRSGFWDWSWWYGGVSVGGVTPRNLIELDLSQPILEGLDLVAEMSMNWSEYGRRSLGPEIQGEEYDPKTFSLFNKKMQDQLKPVYSALLNENAKDWKFATNNKELVEVLQNLGIDINDVVDPWHTPYRYGFSIGYRHRTISIISAGPDKQFDNSDDINVSWLYWQYFKPYGKIIDRTIKETYAASGSYVRDFDTLNAALILRGLDLNTLRDPWGNPYILHFSVSNTGSAYLINVQSRGPYGDRLWEIWTSSIDYFEQSRSSIDKALFDYFRSTHLFPGDDESFDRALAGSGFEFRKLVDPWGQPYYIKYSYAPEYSNKLQITYNPDARTQDSIAVTRKIAQVQIFSSGPDQQRGGTDDFIIASYSQDISEQSGKDLRPSLISGEPLSGFNGAIKGVVTDQTAGLLPGVSILAKLRPTGQEFSVISESDGSYLIRNISPGVYDVSYSLSGFKIANVRDVPVHSTSITTVNVVLALAYKSEQTVEVTAHASDLILESSSSVGTVISLGGTSAQVKEEMFTPRLRDYFPETLYWAPSIITDAAGRARIKFKLADNITTWKMTVLASTKTGEIGFAEKEFEAFQPFFLDHDPPKVLTVGDEIDLPVVARNYLPQAQTLNIEMKPASWFDLQNSGKQSISVDAGESKPVVFPFKAKVTIKSGKQQVYAANRATGDAIEKTIRVHPDGLEQSSTVSGILGNDNKFLLQIPGEIIPGSLNARLKIYPNLIAHVAESIESGLERPYGCGEQAISSIYPSLMLLKYYKASGKTTPSLQKRAERYLKLGYQRLLNYREPTGGFSYWGHSDADVALSAYAVRFLYDASSFITIDPEIISKALEWLASKQEKDGSWKPRYGYENGSLTGYIAVSLAQAGKNEKDKFSNALKEALARALTYLSDPHKALESPYALAQLVLAAFESGNNQKAAAALEKLSKLAHQERSGFYWAIEDNTPFYGWGRAGRIETTAMAVLALSKIGADSAETRQLIDGGILWLLQQKDHYGVWYSGQATVTVLSAILSRIAGAAAIAPDTRVTVLVNDHPFELKGSELQSDTPVFLDVTDHIRSGDNNIAIKSSRTFPAASIQAVADYYLPWTGPSVREVTRLGDSSALRLAVKFDKTEAKIGDRINCTVEVERIGSRGWGMLIAEVGLPPGADVERSVLEEAIKKSRWAVSRYDVFPDRIVLYLWPRAGGVNVAFSFKPRYGLRARTGSSTLYDYYNPDAQVSLPPADFVVHGTAPKKDIAANEAH